MVKNEEKYRTVQNSSVRWVPCHTEGPKLFFGVLGASVGKSSVNGSFEAVKMDEIGWNWRLFTNLISGLNTFYDRYEHRK